MSEKKNEKFPYLEEVLVQTHTTRDDWLIGSSAIATALGYKNSTSSVGSRPDIDYLLTRVHNDAGQTDALLIARKSAVAIHVAKKQEKDTSAANGAKPVLIDQKSGVALASVQDVQELKIAMSELTLAVKSLHTAIAANSTAIKALHDAWEK